MDSNEEIALPKGKKDALDELTKWKIKLVETNKLINECINIFNVAIDNAWETDDIDYDGNVFNLVIDLVGYRSANKVISLVDRKDEQND